MQTEAAFVMDSSHYSTTILLGTNMLADISATVWYEKARISKKSKYKKKKRD